MLVRVSCASSHSLGAIEQKSPAEPLKEATHTDRFGKDKGPRGLQMSHRQRYTFFQNPFVDKYDLAGAGGRL